MKEPIIEPISKDLLVAVAVLVLKKAIKISKLVVGDTLECKSRFCTIYFGALVRDASAFLLLVENGLAYSGIKLIRSILEYHVGVLNIAKSDWYAEYLVFESLYNEIKRIEKIEELGRSKKYKNKLSINDHNKEMLQKVLARFAGKWPTPIGIEDKFRLCKMQDVYTVYYSLYSDNVHGRISCLLGELTAEEGLKQIVNLSTEMPIDDLRELLGVLMVSLCQATECYCSVLGFECLSELSEMKYTTKRFQDLYC